MKTRKMNSQPMKIIKNHNRRKLKVKSKKNKQNSKSSPLYSSQSPGLTPWSRMKLKSLKTLCRTWKTRRESWLQETISWSSTLKDLSKKFKILMMLTLKTTGKLVSRSLLHTMCGTPKMRFKTKKLNMGNARPRLFGSDFKVDSMRCKSVVADWSSTCTRKKANWTNLKKVSNKASRKNLRS